MAKTTEAKQDRYHKFGWCITGHHNDCRKQYQDWNAANNYCNCDCHKEQE